MNPTLRDGDRVLVLRYWPLTWLRRDHIVVSKVSNALELTPQLRSKLAKEHYIKRIIGMPGDTLIVHLSELPEESRKRECAKYDNQGYRTWHIPAGHYFLRGDGASSDSSVWGPIPMHDFRGLIIAKLSGSGRPTVSI
jgi:signal peptidase I